MIKRIVILIVIASLAAVIDVALRFALFDAPPPIHPPTLQAYEGYLAPNQIGALSPDKPVYPAGARLNRFGMRMGAVSVDKPENSVRIAIMGGSAAYGWGVSQQQSFAALVGPLLEQGSGGANIEVLNFGAPGFSTYQGAKQYEWLVHNFSPDILVLAFGLYDGFEARVSDADWYGPLEEAGAGLAPNLISQYSALGHWWGAGGRVAAMQQVQQLYDERLKSNQWTPRVSFDEFKTNLSAIIQHHTQSGGGVVLANLNLLNYAYSDALRSLAEEVGAPFFDARAMFDSNGGRTERQRAARMNLAPANRAPSDASNSTITFRVFAPSVSSGVSVVGREDWLGGGVPGRVQLYDDGTHGDERARDSVWTLSVRFSGGRPVDYAFVPALSEGLRGRETSEALNEAKNQTLYFRLPAIEWATVVDETTVIYELGKAPFGAFLLADDEALPNAKGHTAIAQRLASVIQQYMFGEGSRVAIFRNLNS